MESTHPADRPIEAPDIPEPTSPDQLNDVNRGAAVVSSPDQNMPVQRRNVWGRFSSGVHDAASELAPGNVGLMERDPSTEAENKPNTQEHATDVRPDADHTDRRAEGESATGFNASSPSSQRQAQLLTERARALGVVVPKRMALRAGEIITGERVVDPEHRTRQPKQAGDRESTEGFNRELVAGRAKAPISSETGEEPAERPPAPAEAEKTEAGGDAAQINAGIQAEDDVDASATEPPEKPPPVEPPAGTAGFDGDDDEKPAAGLDQTREAPVAGAEPGVDSPLEHQDPVEAAEEGIRSLYRPQAAGIVEALEGNPDGSVVVTGPLGSGKSESLIPELRKNLEEKGRPVETVSVQGVSESELGEYLEAFLPEVEQRGGVVILDEAGSVADIAPRVIEVARSLGYSDVIPVIAYDVNDPDARTAAAEEWRSAAGGDAAVIDLPPLVLPPEAVHELVAARNEQLGVAPAVTDYIARHVPPNLRALDSVIGEPTIERVKTALLDNLDRLAGSIPEAELEGVRQALEHRNSEAMQEQGVQRLDNILAEVEGPGHDAMPMIFNPELGGDLGAIAYKASGAGGPSFADLPAEERDQWTVRALALAANPDGSEVSDKILAALDLRGTASEAEIPNPAEIKKEHRYWAPGELLPSFREAVHTLRSHGIDVLDPRGVFKNSPGLNEFLPQILDSRFTTVTEVSQALAERLNREGSEEELQRTVSPTYVSQVLSRAFDQLRQKVPEDVRDLLPKPTGSVRGETPEGENRGEAGPRLKAVFQEAGITQRELAGLLDESETSVLRLLGGQVHPSTAKFKSLVSHAFENHLIPQGEAEELIQAYRMEQRAGDTPSELPQAYRIPPPRLHLVGAEAEQPIVDAFQEQVGSDPRGLVQALDSLSSNWIERGSLHTPQTTEDPAAHNAVVAILERGVDRRLEYDSVTEARFDNHPRVQELMHAHRNAPNRQAQERITRELRLLYLKTYIDRIIG